MSKIILRPCGYCGRDNTDIYGRNSNYEVSCPRCEDWFSAYSLDSVINGWNERSLSYEIHRKEKEKQMKKKVKE